MKTFKQFLEEAANSITRFREHGYGLRRGGREAPTNLPPGMSGYGLILKKLMSRKPKNFGKDDSIPTKSITDPNVRDKNSDNTNPIKKIKAWYQLKGIKTYFVMKNQEP